MDNLTHTLAGAALGEAGLKRLSGLGMAALMIGANLPDVDVAAIPLGESLTFRRGWTHGPLAWLVLPVLLTLALMAWDGFQARRGTRPEGRAAVRPAQLLLISFAAVLSHPFLDWLNTYGIRLLMPFDEEWFYGDSVFIIDPWIWLALGLGVSLSRRRARGGGAPATRHMTAATGRVPQRVMAGPAPLHPLRREVIFDMGDHYRFGSVAWTPGPELSLQSTVLPINSDHPAVRASMGSEPVRDFLYWSRFPFFSVEEDEGGTVVRVNDVRFSRRDAEGWSTVTVRIPTPARPRIDDAGLEPPS